LGRANKGVHVSEQRAVRMLFENQYFTPQSSYMAIAAFSGG
jgi:hypothetical protein